MAGATFTFVPNPVGLATLLHAPEGEVGRDLFRRGEILLAAAKMRCPVGKTGNLRRGLTVSVGGERAVLTSDQPYAEYVAGGTAEHTVSPRTGGVLRFEVSGGYGPGEVVFTRNAVTIPARSPNRFALDALEVAMR